MRARGATSGLVAGIDSPKQRNRGSRSMRTAQAASRREGGSAGASARAGRKLTGHGPDAKMSRAPDIDEIDLMVDSFMSPLGRSRQFLDPLVDTPSHHLRQHTAETLYQDSAEGRKQRTTVRAQSARTTRPAVNMTGLAGGRTARAVILAYKRGQSAKAKGRSVNSARQDPLDPHSLLIPEQELDEALNFY